MVTRQRGVDSSLDAHRIFDAAPLDTTALDVTAEPDGPEPLWSLPANTLRWWLGPALLLSVVGGIALLVDIGLSWQALTRHCPGLLRDLLRFAEMFGNGLGVILLAIVIYALDPLRRPALARLLIVTLGTGLAVDVLKMLVGRARPHSLDLRSSDVWATFVDWLPLLGNESSSQSFPSGHTATAVAFAVMLAVLYPHGRRLFTACAILVAVQRVQCGAHFLSDVLWGAAVGWFLALASFRPSVITRAFDRLESRWQGEASRVLSMPSSKQER